MVRIAFHQSLGQNRELMSVVGVADVVHVALGGRKARAVLRHEVHTWISAVKPDGRRRSCDIEDDTNASRLHLVHYSVEPLEVELAFCGLERILRQVTYVNDI